MNAFESRWKQLSRTAQEAAESSDDAAPFGFASRVVAHWPPRENVHLVWQTLVFRTLGAMTALLLVVLVTTAATSSASSPLNLEWEETVADALWLQ